VRDPLETELAHTTLYVAVDWSGRVRGERRHLWLAAARDGRVERLECGRTRAELVAHLIELAGTERRVVAGLDFAFGLPAWFAREHGCRTARDVWELVRGAGEDWLARCPPPFWGHPGRRRPAAHADRPPYRRTEGELIVPGGVRPKSVFQVGGAGAVGTGSLRGMPHLLELADAGFEVWPQTARRPGARHVVFEIWPRLLTGPVTKARRAARTTSLATLSHGQSAELLRRAATSEDAFDAFLSALALARHAPRALPAARDADERLEGRIWTPPADALALRMGGADVIPSRSPPRPPSAPGARAARADRGARAGRDGRR